jgi:hypothetical protein
MTQPTDPLYELLREARDRLVLFDVTDEESAADFECLARIAVWMADFAKRYTAPQPPAGKGDAIPREIHERLKQKAWQLAQMLADQCNNWGASRFGPPTNPVRPEDYLKDVIEVYHDPSTDPI